MQIKSWQQNSTTEGRIAQRNAVLAMKMLRFESTRISYSFQCFDLQLKLPKAHRNHLSITLVASTVWLLATELLQMDHTLISHAFAILSNEVSWAADLIAQNRYWKKHRLLESISRSSPSLCRGNRPSPFEFPVFLDRSDWECSYKN